MLRSRAQCGESRVCLFQGEIGDRPCLLGMLLVMRSQEMCPSGSVSLPLTLSLPYSLYPYFPFLFLFFTLVMLYSAQFTLFLSPLNQPSSDSFFSSPPTIHCCLVFSYCPFTSRSCPFGHLWCLPVCVRACACISACLHTSISALRGALALSNLSSEVIIAPSGEALNDCEMLMQLIREAKSREGRGLNKKGRLDGVKRRARAKIKSA